MKIERKIRKKRSYDAAGLRKVSPIINNFEETLTRFFSPTKVGVMRSGFNIILTLSSWRILIA